MVQEAIRVLSNVAELEAENHELLRTLAHRLLQYKEYTLGIYTFKEIARIREEEPQSFRDLGLAYFANKEFQQAFDALVKVVNTNWDGRFPEIELLALGELNQVINASPIPLNANSLNDSLKKHLDMDMRVVIDWDADNCDMDLWVTDPSGEKCFYSNPDNKYGGHISRDFTGGYGPEEFIMHKAIKGTYKIQVNYYGSHQTTLSGPTSIKARLITNYGRPSQQEQEIHIRLTEKSEVVELGTMLIE
jgi:tetratricopeptide (TPR) repeat protein